MSMSDSATSEVYNVPSLRKAPKESTIRALAHQQYSARKYNNMRTGGFPCEDDLRRLVNVLSVNNRDRNATDTFASESFG